MDKINLEQISRMTYTSKATVSRALNHCPGVDSCTRARIQEAARTAGYQMPEKRPAQVGLILPTLPSYFWDEMRWGVGTVLAESGQPCRTALYSSLYGTEEVLSCIAAVSADSPKILGKYREIAYNDRERENGFVFPFLIRICVGGAADAAGRFGR